MKLFPLKTWETFRVIIPERHNAVGGDLFTGIVHGRPGEGEADIVHRARTLGLLGLFQGRHIQLEWVDR